ncbi:hypothetical protein Scep_015376 [Stephania cephalantha]|uniref:Sulfite exporter TauE/SafE family protein n=1 Tax=Stephania cephalantha TaxID=152367 RepID=A0AAP0J3V9_9MAGN
MVGGTKAFVLYLTSLFSLAIVLSVLFFDDLRTYLSQHGVNSVHNGLNSALYRDPNGVGSVFGSHNGGEDRGARIWPKLEFSWRVGLATLIGFLGSACGTVGGVGGGGIFVPMLNLIVGFDTKSAAALSKCNESNLLLYFIFSFGTVAVIEMKSFIVELDFLGTVAVIEMKRYDNGCIYIFCVPMLMLGITFGVALSVVFPFWLVTILIIILFVGTSGRSFFKGVEMWKQETILKIEMEAQKQATADSIDNVVIGGEYEPLITPTEEKSVFWSLTVAGHQNTVTNGVGLSQQPLVCVGDALTVLFVAAEKMSICSRMGFCLLGASTSQTLRFNLRWKGLLVLMTVWNNTKIPIALVVFGFEAVKLNRECKKRRTAGNLESVCEATIRWTVPHIAFCAFCGILGGTVGGLLGSGGGFILGPLLLELGVIPQVEVASATATFVMMYSSSLSVIEFYFLNRFPMPFALYLMSVSLVAGFWGQCIVRKLVAILKRGSLIVFILSGVIFASALTMGVVGTQKSIDMIHHHDYMGFLDFCSSS